MTDLTLKIILVCFLFLVIIQDIRSYTISLYHLIGVFICTLNLDFFSLLSGLLGGSILLCFLIYITFFSKKIRSDVIGSGDLVFLSILFFVTPLSHISTLLFLSGVFGISFFYIFKKNYVPLGAGIAFAYGSIIFLL